MPKKIKPIHPGEILEEDFLIPLSLTQYRLAKEIKVPARRINEIVRGTRRITANTALRLSRYFGTSPFFWLNLQGRYDLEDESEETFKNIEREIIPLRAEAREEVVVA